MKRVSPNVTLLFTAEEVSDAKTNAMLDFIETLDRYGLTVTNKAAMKWWPPLSSYSPEGIRKIAVV